MQDNFTLPNIAHKYSNLIVMVHYNIFEKTITLFKGKIGISCQNTNGVTILHTQ